jgi:fatty-acyl-CoA synthase
MQTRTLSQLLNTTIGNMFDNASTANPDHLALIMPEFQARLTYREYENCVNAAAKGLMTLGVEKDQHVALWSPNRPEWFFIQYALAKIGAVLVTVNTLFKADELAYVLCQSDSTTLLLSNGFRELDYIGTVYQIAPEIKTSQPGEIESQAFPNLKRIITLDDTENSGIFNWSELVEAGKAITDDTLAERQQAVLPEDPACIIYTSGTTGFPKGVLLRHNGLVAESYYLGQSMDIHDDDRCLLPMPVFAAGGLLGGSIMSVNYGITLIASYQFDAAKILELIEIEKPTVGVFVNTMFVMLMDHPDFSQRDVTSFKRAFSAGAPSPIPLMKEIEARFGMKMILGYGLTESHAVITTTAFDDPPEIRLATVGTAIPGVKISIIDPESGNSVAPGQQGEICLSGWCNMLGYYNKSAETEKAINAEGWMHTGDLGTIDSEDYLRVTGRLKDMIIRGGANIYAKEIEEVLQTHPKVAEAYVVGVPNRRYGEEVLACVMLRSNETATKEEISRFCSERLARYKLPQYIVFVDAWPLTNTGKVQKFRLAEMGIAHFGLSEE